MKFTVLFKFAIFDNNSSALKGALIFCDVCDVCVSDNKSSNFWEIISTLDYKWSILRLVSEILIADVESGWGNFRLSSFWLIKSISNANSDILWFKSYIFYVKLSTLSYVAVIIYV